MTDDEKRELIAEARTVLAGIGIDLMRDLLIDRLADALEGALDESEWEYGVKVTKTVPGDEVWLGGVYGVGTEAEARVAEQMNNGNETCLVRRRKAGPWEVVTDDRD